MEPLEIVLPDAVSRLPFPDAVAALDAFLAQRALGGVPAPLEGSAELSSWGERFLTHRLGQRWKAAVSFADARAESPAESVSRALIHQLGFAAPALQVRIATDIGEERVDFEWVVEDDSRAGSPRPRRIIGEFDGRGKYFDEALLQGRSAKDVHYAEKQREDALRRTGRGMVRWEWADLARPGVLAVELSQAGVPRRRPATRSTLVLGATTNDPSWLSFPVPTSRPENSTTQEGRVSSG